MMINKLNSSIIDLNPTTYIVSIVYIIVHGIVTINFGEVLYYRKCNRWKDIGLFSVRVLSVFCSR
jgi:hypothetical protein